MITAQDVATFISREVLVRKTPIGAYWYEVSGDRQAAALGLVDVSPDVCIIPLFPRKGFDNANALPSDFMELLEQERSSIEPRAAEAFADREPICFVLLSRTRLREPLIGSPVKMPDWMPYCGGNVIALDIVDVVGAATSTLNSQQEAIGKLQVLLYEIQGLMLEKLLELRARDNYVTQKFFSELLPGGEKTSDFLSVAVEKHRISTAEGFRAVASPKSSELIGRIVGIVGAKSPAQLPSFGTALFTALAISSESAAQLPESLIAVAFRSTMKEFETDRAKRAARNAVLALYCGSQLVTAAAHAGEYGEFSVSTMRTIIADCESALNSLKWLLN